MIAVVIYLLLALGLVWALAAVPAPHRHRWPLTRLPDGTYVRTCSCGAVRDHYGHLLPPGK